MRGIVDAAKLERFMAELGRRARGPGRIYLIGDATALLVGWRASTVDVDLKLDPEPAGAFEAIAAMLSRGLFAAADLVRALGEVEGELARYPGLDAAAFCDRVRDFAERARV